MRSTFGSGQRVISGRARPWAIGSSKPSSLLQTHSQSSSLLSPVQNFVTSSSDKMPSHWRFSTGSISFPGPSGLLSFFFFTLCSSCLILYDCLQVSFFPPFLLELICCQGPSLYPKSAPGCQDVTCGKGNWFIGPCKCIIGYSPSAPSQVTVIIIPIAQMRKLMRRDKT